MNRRTRPGKLLSEGWRKINRIRSRVRFVGESPSSLVKGLWGFREVRYRGIAKSLARGFTGFALANLYRVRRELIPPGARCAL